jgi:hypothetical protein
MWRILAQIHTLTAIERKIWLENLKLLEGRKENILDNLFHPA